MQRKNPSKNADMLFMGNLNTNIDTGKTSSRTVLRNLLTRLFRTILLLFRIDHLFHPRITLLLHGKKIMIMWSDSTWILQAVIHM